eukprot:6212095-Pleurochrysis_carterae.AAC.2
MAKALAIALAAVELEAEAKLWRCAFFYCSKGAVRGWTYVLSLRRPCFWPDLAIRCCFPPFRLPPRACTGLASGVAGVSVSGGGAEVQWYYIDQQQVPNAAKRAAAAAATAHLCRTRAHGSAARAQQQLQGGLVRACAMSIAASGEWRRAGDTRLVLFALSGFPRSSGHDSRANGGRLARTALGRDGAIAILWRLASARGGGGGAGGGGGGTLATAAAAAAMVVVAVAS